MKKVLAVLVLSVIVLSGYCQDTAVLIENDNSGIIVAGNDTNKRVETDDRHISIEESNDEVNISIGDRGMRILESLEGSDIDFFNHNHKRSDDDNEEDIEKLGRKGFEGHWSGIELGFNNFMTGSGSMSLPDDIYYMSVHSGKSSNFNLNFAQLSLGITKHFGFVTGLGFTFNNYRFEGNNNIMKGANGIIEPFYPSFGITLAKSKLTTTYLHVPVLLELQIPAGNSDHLNLSAGVIAGVKIASHTKMVYEVNHQKIKDNGDLSLNMLRYGATVRAGYGMFQLYGTYYATPLFKSGKGPELYPFEVGISISFEG